MFVVSLVWCSVVKRLADFHSTKIRGWCSVSAANAKAESGPRPANTNLALGQWSSYLEAQLDLLMQIAPFIARGSMELFSTLKYR